MNPTEFAAKVHGQISVLRDGHEAVAAHARNAAEVHTLVFPDGPVADLDPAQPLALSPFDLSNRLLRALFNDWPGTAPASPPPAPRPAGLVVTELDWSEWERAAETSRAA